MKIKTAHLGLFLAVAIILGYVESLVPFFAGIPGIKLGLPNLAIILCLYLYGRKYAIAINIARIVICCFLFTNPYAFMYSLAGALLSFAGMALLYKKKAFSVCGIGIIGAVLHNVAQIVTAMIVTETNIIIAYLPILLLSGLITGFCIGFLAKLLLPKLKFREN